MKTQTRSLKISINATKSNNSIGVYIGSSEKVLLKRKALECNLSLNKYVANLIRKDLDLPSGKQANEVAELILRVEQLERENQRLKYEGNFNTESFNSSGVEIVDETLLVAPKIIEQV